VTLTQLDGAPSTSSFVQYQHEIVMPGLNPTQQGQLRDAQPREAQADKADIDQFVAITQASPEDAEHFLATGTTLQVSPPLTHLFARRGY
jgi:hypothetical protein